MATDLVSLKATLSTEVGNLIADADLVNTLVAGVNAYNALAMQAFVVTGTSLDRDATSLEQRAIVLLAVRSWLRGQALYWSANAVSVSNVAGKTNIDGIELALSKRLKELEATELKEIIAKLVVNGVCSEVKANELGETKDVSGTGTPLPSFTEIVRP